MGIDHTSHSSKHSHLNRPASGVENARKLHRLGETRQREEISRRSIARRLGVDVATVELQEGEFTDIPLSALYAWQDALGVPLVELLVDSDERHSTPAIKRGQLVRLMKTALSILEQAEPPPLRLLAERLVGQLLDVMPELREVNSWPDVGQRRRRDDYGRAARHSLPDELFFDRGE